MIDPSVPSALTKAVNDGKLPNLRHIELRLLQKNVPNWPEVHDFCYEANDLTLYLPDVYDVQKLLSKLTCLTLEHSRSAYKRLENVDRFFTQQLTKLSILKLIKIDIQCFSSLANVLKQDKLPNLSELFVSCSLSSKENQNLFDSSLRNFHPKHTPRLEKVSLRQCIMSEDELRTVSDNMSSFQLRELDVRDNKGIRGCLSMLFKNNFPTLQSLTIGNSELHQEDLESLVFASEQGKLPNLRHLFIHCKNPKTIHLFTGREKWNQLLTLCIGGWNVLGLRSEYLIFFQSLDLRNQEVRGFTIGRCWPQLQMIKSDNNMILSEVFVGVKKGLLPALKIVRAPAYVSPDFGFDFQKANITYIRD